MENASKALIMAGGVLISLMVIALLVFFFNNIRDLQNINLTSEEAEQAAEFNKQFDVYARNVYGSELLSIANKVLDYNKREANSKGYTQIEVEVILTRDIDSQYFKEEEGTINANEIKEKIDKIKEDVNKLGIIDVKFLPEGSDKYITRKVSKLATMRTADIEALGTTTQNYKTLIAEYNTQKNIIPEMKQSIFTYKKFEFDDNTGRVTKMIYEL